MILEGFKGVGGVQAGSDLNIPVASINNPISLRPRTGFKVTTMDADGNAINVTNDLTLTMTEVFTHLSAGESSVLLRGDTAPARLGSYVCQFKTTLPIPVGGYITLTLPQQIVLDAQQQLSGI